MAGAGERGIIGIDRSRHVTCRIGHGPHRRDDHGVSFGQKICCMDPQPAMEKLPDIPSPDLVICNLSKVPHAKNVHGPAQGCLSPRPAQRMMPDRNRGSGVPSVLDCQHGNENPRVCPCSKTCFCRQMGNTCGPRAAGSTAPGPDRDEPPFDTSASAPVSLGKRTEIADLCGRFTLVWEPRPGVALSQVALDAVCLVEHGIAPAPLAVIFNGHVLYADKTTTADELHANFSKMFLRGSETPTGVMDASDIIDACWHAADHASDRWGGTPAAEAISKLKGKLALLPAGRANVASAEWITDCTKWRKKTLTGKFAHWCHDWDGLPVDETCDEWSTCSCFPSDGSVSSVAARYDRALAALRLVANLGGQSFQDARTASEPARQFLVALPLRAADIDTPGLDLWPEHKLTPVEGREGPAECVICGGGGAEGTLLSRCPGRRVPSAWLSSCYEGQTTEQEIFLRLAIVREFETWTRGAAPSRKRS